MAGDILGWLIGGRLPHVGVVVRAGPQPEVVHNIGGGAQQVTLAALRPHRAVAHYRWPKPA